MNNGTERPALVMVRWTCAALIAALTFAYILGQLMPATPAVAG